MEACEAFLRETWPILEGLDYPNLQLAMEAAQGRIEVLDEDEPAPDEENYEDWANLRENMEDLVEDIMDLMEAEEE